MNLQETVDRLLHITLNLEQRIVALEKVVDTRPQMMRWRELIAIPWNKRTEANQQEIEGLAAWFAANA